MTRQRLITPSKITAWLDCPHYLTLRNKVDDGELMEPDQVFGSFAQLLLRKGEAHEQACLDEYRSQGKSVFEVPPRHQRESFADWVARVGNPLANGWDVVYQMPFVHDGVRGIADFVERLVDPETGDVSYEPVDAKLTRVDAKPGHVLQLCFYADALEALTGVDPERIHILLGSGRRETLRINEFRPYWRRLRKQLSAAIDAGPGASTVPEPCPHCEFCEFFSVCDDQWRDEDSLIYIPGIRGPEREVLGDGGVTTLAQLGELHGDFAGIGPERLKWLVTQAALQVAAQLNGDAPPPFSMILPGEDAQRGHGFELLPEPDPADIFLDFEGHPFWRADRGLFFLFGLIERDGDDEWRYQSWWAHSPEQEAQAVTSLIGYLAARREQYPTMHVYHYNHTERSALEALAAAHGVAEAELSRLVQTGLFVDLLAVTRNSIQVGTESYSLKCVERLTDFQRSHVIDKGAGAVVQYEEFMADGDDTKLNAIATYNEDDVRATKAFRDWLIEHRPPELPWREAQFETSQVLLDIDEQVAACHAFDNGSLEYLLGDLLGFWTREWLAYIAPKLAQCQQDSSELLDERDAITGLQPVGLRPRSGKAGKELKVPAMRFTFPPQSLDGFPHGDEEVLYLLPDGKWTTADIDQLDRDACELDLKWNEQKQDAGHFPSTVVVHSWVRTDDKRKALSNFASGLLEGKPANRVTEALLGRELPQFRDGGGRRAGLFADDIDEMVKWATLLDRSYVAVQGPPGTGKTYRAAHMVHALVVAGQRVGVTAFSHRAIENLLRKVVEVFEEKGDLGNLCAVRKPPVGSTQKLDGIKNGDTSVCARSDYNLVGGTTWLFSSEKMRDTPVDVLLIDEAGQLALADAVAASTSARNLILLGDPLQLPHVMQALHPGGGGRSVLEHVLGEEVTLPNDRGVFLAETRRMHPDICGFVSAEIYEGRLGYHKNCARQTTVSGTGLRWLRADHEGNSTSSAEEAQMIADEIGRLIGTPWTGFDGDEKPLTVHDFMVVAPYNDQVRVIRQRLDSDPRTASVPVGTVDKFQGGEAAVVFFSMATSSGADMVRGADFLFSRNRLNVAISRARCLAYLVCTEELLNARARSVEEMRLIATLDAFVEWAPVPVEN
ncbi:MULTISPECIES: TM0106 family RecB-like putative nuclease [unclassified Mycobacterium]|uniref:TM0106 family RecB-like putative nuclease n=1 Tax=unclassified Mycobacterium TaxID=2642494 RepID=UPI000A496BE0|nr:MULTISPECIES: TM0106 family RecB-like putative nuclease [unclassified Mycobacterium]